MTYSCSDFTDEILNRMGELGMLKEGEVPDDEPGEQGPLAIMALNKLHQQRDALAVALRGVMPFLEKDAVRATLLYKEDFDVAVSVARAALEGIEQQPGPNDDVDIDELIRALRAAEHFIEGLPDSYDKEVEAREVLLDQINDALVGVTVPDEK